MRRLSLFLCLCFAAATAPAAEPADIVPVRLKCEYLEKNAFVTEGLPRLSWTLEPAKGAEEKRGLRQTAYRILIADSIENLADPKRCVRDSGKVNSAITQAMQIDARFTAVYYWKVKVWDASDHESPWSLPAHYFRELLRPPIEWFSWLTFDDTSPLHRDSKTLFLPPAHYFRKEFSVSKPVRRAILKASARGNYDAYLNGRRASDAMFLPGWSDYRRRIYCNTFDVTELVKQGSNAIGVVLTDGWYSGYVGYALLCGYGPNKVGRYLYGKTPEINMELSIEYTDDSEDVVYSDTTWQVTNAGPIREADILMGEAYDARLEQPDWCKPGFDAKGWAPAVRPDANGRPMAVFHDNRGQREVELFSELYHEYTFHHYPAQPVRPIQEMPAISVVEQAPGVFIYDIGQNIAGVARLKIRGERGTKIQLRFGEMLHPDGRLMTENLRRARATDCYILRGDPAGETWTPRFTYHGFRYVELTGVKEKPPLDAITGIVIHSDTPLTSRFECSDPMVNKLFQNIVWTQRANFVEVPTDCPQRDERLGWSGDAQIYIGAACYNADVAAFFTKWLDDLEEAQLSTGAYPDYAPYPMSHGKPNQSCCTAWTDVGIICPWTIWRVYGDTRVIERHYDSMQRFMNFRMTISRDFRGAAFGNEWGDWLNMNEPTPIEYIDACYFAHSARLMSEMAQAIGKKVDAENYRRLRKNIEEAFRKDYLKPDGTLKVDTQTAYAIALEFGLIPEANRKAAADRLAKKIADNGGRMATGFLGTKPLLPALSANGHHELAVQLLQSKKMPSWGFEIENGATTVWERWDSYTKDGSWKKHAGMNSFSHYAFGAVCEWMFRSLAGIDSEEPGFRQILIRPRPGGNIDWVKAGYDSPAGPIAVAWKRTAADFACDVEIPPNATAKVILPATNAGSVTETGRPLAQSPGVKVLGSENGEVTVEIGSGKYWFLAKNPSVVGKN